MKKFISLSVLASLILLLASCSKIEKVLPKKDGTWTIQSQTTSEYESNTLDTTYTETNVGTFVFEKDGAGTFTDADSTYNLSWTADDKEETVTVCQDFFGASFCVTYDVLEAGKDEQKWATHIEYSAGEFDEIEMVIQRKE